MVWMMKSQELSHRSGDTGSSEEKTIPEDLNHFINETEHLM